MIRGLAVALAAAVLYAALGLAVAHAPPAGVDVAGAALAGEAQHLALLFTRSCLWYMLVSYGVAGLAVAAVSRAWRGRILFSIAVALVTWRVSDALKDLFHRPRPAYWRLLHETSYSYSSGHAMFATVVFGLWAWFIWNSGLPRRIRLAVAPLLAIWALGVLWSRLALGAHYVTDLAGGVLLGAAALGLGAAIVAAAAQRRPVGTIQTVRRRLG